MNKKEKALKNFIDVDENEELKKNEKVVKTDLTIIERVDKIIIDESGKQLLREVY